MFSCSYGLQSFIIYIMFSLLYLTWNTDLDICKKILELQEDLFHKFNVWRAKALDCGFEAAIGVSMFDTAKTFGTENIDAIK